MTEEIGGRGDPVKVLELLWGKAEPGKRGPKARVGVADLVAAAVTIADAEGLSAVSTRRVAEKVGISPMSFYTHVPGKAELLDLMLDAVAVGEPDDPPPASDADWRARVTFVAETLWRHYLRHPWVLDLATHRPVLGPNTVAAYEFALSAVDGLGLTELEMDMTVTVLANYVHGAVRDAARGRMVDELTGMSDEEWWRRIEPFLEALDYSPYPVASRVGPVAGETYGVGDPQRAFRFGLDRLLDGLALFIEGKRR